MLQADLFLNAKAQLAEGPVWDDRRNELVWVDILRGQIHRTSEDGGADDVTALDEPVGAVALTDDAGMLAAAASGFRLVDREAGHPLLAALPEQNARIRMNDGKCDPRGRFVAGTMAYDNEPGVGTLYSYDGSRVRRLLSGVTISNGLAWSADGTTMYYVDTPTRRIDAFDYDLETGTISARRTEVVLPEGTGDPDGITMDDEEGLWVALWGGHAIHRYEAGRVTERLTIPAANVTSCTFGGRRRRRLYITTAPGHAPDGGGALYAVDLTVSGPPPARGHTALVSPEATL